MELNSFKKQIIADYLKSMLVDFVSNDEQINNLAIALAIKGLEDDDK